MLVGSSTALHGDACVCGHYRSFRARPPLIHHKGLWRGKDWASELVAVAHKCVLVMVNFCVHVARLPYPAVWSNTGVDVAMKVFFRCD